MKPAFDIAALNISWPSILPLIAVTVTAVLVLLIGVHVEDDDSAGLGWLSLGGLIVALFLSFALFGKQEQAFAGAIALDNFTAYFYVVILLVAGVTVLMSLDYVRELGLAGAEYYALTLFATIGMMLMAAAGDLIIIFLGLETMSISVYVLAGLVRRQPKSSEAALKYFILGAFSTGFLLYGIALLYGATGSIKLNAIGIAMRHAAGSNNPLLLLGLGMLLIGFGFKVAAVPFHMWTPDAYEGAPTSVTAFMAAGVKLAAFAGFVRLFIVHLWPVRAEWSMVLWVMAVATMVAGNLIAVMQSNVKRMLAYSAIAHAGYILVAMTAGGPSAGTAILFYLLGYVFTNLGAFAVLIALARRGEAHDTIADLRGLSARQPMLAAAMAIFMLSLTGVPPLAGFIGKFYLFAAAIESGYVGLVVIASIMSTVSAYYYIGVIVAMYMSEGGTSIIPLRVRPTLAAAVAIAVVGTVIIGVYPGPYLEAAASAFTSAYGPRPSPGMMIPMP
ncbi:MAG TPA: NADH-quinone oxidoreductase subunit N [Candidatus Binataceae bacterium]|nr:NADH-quinone oxidoreductase subunit N [Candidatus Binataceae bacterium]